MPVDVLAKQPVDIFAKEGQDALGAPSTPTGSQPPGEDSFADNAFDVVGELAAASNRSLTEFLDFLGPGSVNALLRLAGSDTQLPTITGALEETGIQGGFMEPGTARDVVRGAGTALTAAGGLKTVARPQNVRSVVEEFLGVGTTKAPALPAVNQALMDNTGDTITATKKFAVDPTKDPQNFNPREIVKDRAATDTINQGFEEGFVAMTKSVSPQAKARMREMLGIVRKGKGNYRYAADNRPLDVVGDSVMDRFKVVRSANRAVAKKLDAEANKLRGKRVDFSPAIDDFLSDLGEMGVKYDPRTNKIDYSASNLEGKGKNLKAARSAVENVIDRLYNARKADAHEVHFTKKYIDNIVDYGSGKTELPGKVDTIIKRLRHNLDSVLDENFEGYNDVNTEYAETRRALDALQDVAGKKMDLSGPNADKAVGTLTRRLLSNAQSRVPLRDAIDQLDTVARRYAQPQGPGIVPYGTIVRTSGVRSLDDDIMAQLMFADELDSMFGTNARTSLLGDVEKGVRFATKSNTERVADAAISVANRVLGKDEDKALQALEALIGK